jgi:branched-subunit amino acid transport protein
MRLWISLLVVSLATALMRAAGPLALGERRLPSAATRVFSLMAPALLAGLIVVELGGEGWGDVDPDQLAGVATAGVARTLSAPILLAVALGVLATALLRQV